MTFLKPLVELIIEQSTQNVKYRLENGREKGGVHVLKYVKFQENIQHVKIDSQRKKNGQILRFSGHKERK